MTIKSNTITSIALIALAGFASVASARAEQATYAQRMACMSDAFRLCSSEIPHAAAVKACMVAKRSQVSAGCLATWPKMTADR